MSITWRQASTGYLATVVLGPVMPALATRMSGGASSFSVSASALATSVSLVTSTAMATAPFRDAADCFGALGIAIPQGDAAAALR